MHICSICKNKIESSIEDRPKVKAIWNVETNDLEIVCLACYNKKLLKLRKDNETQGVC